MTQATEACRELELQPLSDIDIKTIVTQGVTALDAWIRHNSFRLATANLSDAFHITSYQDIKQYAEGIRGN